MKKTAIGIAVLQIIDIFVHAATNQLEFLRVTSNVFMLVWLMLVLTGKFTMNFRVPAIASIGLYLLLNGIFLAREGLTNPEQGGEPRIILFILVFLTVSLSILLTEKQKNKISNEAN